MTVQLNSANNNIFSDFVKQKQNPVVSTPVNIPPVQDKISFSGNTNSGSISIARQCFQNFKRGFEMNKLLFSPDTLRSIIHDPRAFLYNYLENIELLEKSRKVLGEITLTARKGGKKSPAKIVKTTFSDGTERISIKTKGLGVEQAYIDVKKEGEDDLTRSIYIKYFNNIMGRNKYKGLEQHLLQAVFEDAIRGGKLPKISAVPAEIGENQFSRAAMYKLMGAEVEQEPLITKTGKLIFVPTVSVPHITIRKFAAKMLRKNEFILPETRENIERLLANQKELEKLQKAK